MWGCGLRAGVFGRARLRANLSRVLSLRERIRYEIPSKMDRIPMFCRAVCMWWKEIVCASRQIVDLLCVRELRPDRQNSRREAGPRFVNTRCFCRREFHSFLSSISHLLLIQRQSWCRTTTYRSFAPWPDLFHKNVCPANEHDFINVNKPTCVLD